MLVSDFLALDTLPPCSQLQAHGQLHVIPDDAKVDFVSHQWMSHARDDPDSNHLWTMQTLVRYLHKKEAKSLMETHTGHGRRVRSHKHPLHAMAKRTAGPIKWPRTPKQCHPTPRRTAVLNAAGNGCTACLRYVCQRLPRPHLNRTTPDEGLSALGVAARAGHVAALRTLLEFGADLHLQRKDGRTPLHEAVLAGSADAMRVLLEHGANPHRTDVAGATALDLAAMRKGSSSQRHAEMEAVLREAMRSANGHANGHANGRGNACSLSSDHSSSADAPRMGAVAVALAAAAKLTASMTRDQATQSALNAAEKAAEEYERKSRMQTAALRYGVAGGARGGATETAKAAAAKAMWARAAQQRSEVLARAAAEAAGR